MGQGRAEAKKEVEEQALATVTQQRKGMERDQAQRTESPCQNGGICGGDVVSHELVLVSRAW